MCEFSRMLARECRDQLATGFGDLADVTRMTWYEVGVEPTLRRVRLSFGAQYMSEPSFMREAMPLTVTSTWPDLITTISSLESMILAADDWPTLRVVIWLSRARKVRVGELTQTIREPEGVGVEGMLLQSRTEDASLPGAASSAADLADVACERSVTKLMT